MNKNELIKIREMSDVELNKKLEKNFKKTGVTAVGSYPTAWTTAY